MILDTITEFAQSAADRYGFFLAALQAAYGRAIASSDFGSAAGRNRLMSQASAEAQRFLSGEVAHIEQELSEIYREAHQTTTSELRSADTASAPASATEQLQALMDYLYEEVAAQVSRDISTLKSRYQMSVFEVSLNATSRLRPMKAAQMEYRLINSVSVQFGFKDRASRSWSSQKFYRTLWRHTLLCAYNETVLMTIADHGLGLATVYHVDQKAEVDGMLISLSPGSQHPVYSEIRDTVFHPNANAYLTTGASHVSS